jgi:alpha-tubulin suppressor-like RCC1 family protein
VVSGLPLAQLSPGGAHTCGATTNHRAYCWGRNTTGALGDGTTTRRVSPRLVAGGGLSFDALLVGVFHSCAVLTNDRVYCWGANNRGQLGDGTNDLRLTPVPVTGGLRFATASTGAVGDHSCGVTASGKAYCWGNNASGQIGDGTFDNHRSAPTPVSGPG